MFRIGINYADVTTFNEVSGDWSGNCYGKSIDITVNIAELTLKNIVVALNKEGFADLTKEDFFFENESIGIFTMLENSEGFPDLEGKFLVEYSFEVTGIPKPINLEKLFNNDNKGVA